MSSENSSYESAPLAPDPEVENVTNGPTKEAETMTQEVTNTNLKPDPNANPNPSSDPPKRRGRQKKEVPIEEPPNYLFKFQEEEKVVEPDQAETALFSYKVDDLVWAKVKGHPWWPGQIYHPSLASEAALKIKKQDHFLVAYFGDKTFAWNDASALKPYQTTFPRMEKQSSAEAFVAGVESSLAEVSRRVELALVCRCVDSKSLDKQLVSNAGIIDGTQVPNVDNSVIWGSFNVEKIVEYVQEVSVFGSEKVNRLEVVIARAYLKSFDKFRGFPEAPEFGYGEEFGNDPNKVSGPKKAETGRKRKKKDVKKQEGEATPKKSGTPKKKKYDDSDYDPRSDSDELPKRRGSSRKGKQVKLSSDEYDLSSGTDEVPKKRGRPKKMKLAEICDEEFKPASKARPPSSKLKTSRSSSSKLKTRTKTNTSTSRKRGRPKMKQDESSDEEAKPVTKARSKSKAPSKTDTSTPRKRGRPSKSSDGEFKAATKARSAASKKKTATKTDNSTPRKRGRRKKIEISEEESDLPSKTYSPLPKPKKPTKSDTSTPIKRGRSKKTRGLEISAEESDPRSKTHTLLSKSKPPSQPDTGASKKTGRPKKEALEGPSVPVEYPPATEMLSQLCLIAQYPVNNSSFTPSMHFFTEFKNSLAPDSINLKDLTEEAGGATTSTKSGRRVSKPKHIQDSYWTDVIVDTGSDNDEEPGSTSGGEKKKRGPSKNREEKNGENIEADVAPTEEKMLVTNNMGAENSDESDPTGIVLHFNNAEAIPAEKEFNEMFRAFGSLREAETEIDKTHLRVMVVFKKRADAELAFSSAGEYSKFGPALRSYELEYSPGPPKVLPSNAVVGECDTSAGDGGNVAASSEAATKDGLNLHVSPDEKGKEPAEEPMQVDKPVEPST